MEFRLNVQLRSCLYGPGIAHQKLEFVTVLRRVVELQVGLMPSKSNEGTSKTSSFRQNLLSYLTKLSHGSTPFITTFLLIHLTAPALANLGGSSLSSQTMVREIL